MLVGSKGTVGITAKHLTATGTDKATLESDTEVHVGVKGFRLSIKPGGLVLGQGAAIPPAPPPPIPHAKARIRKKQRADFDHKVAQWKAKVKEHEKKYAPAKKSQVGIWMKEGKIELLVQGSKLVGTSSGWKFNGTTLVVKK